MNRLVSIPVQLERYVEAMRLIYNQNLSDLATKPLPYRSYDAQQNWWNKNKINIRAYLYKIRDKSNDGIIAFLALTNRGSFVIPIFAIDKEFLGKGYGKEIIQDYLEKADGLLAGSQLQANKAICHLNNRFGWEIMGGGR